MHAIMVRKDVSQEAHSAYMCLVGALFESEECDDWNEEFEDRTRKSIWGNAIIFYLLKAKMTDPRSTQTCSAATSKQ